MRIAVDLDGVIWDILSMLVTSYNKKYKKNLTINDIDKWNYFSERVFKKIYRETCKQIDDYCLLDMFSPSFMFLLNYDYHVDILTFQGNSIEKLEKNLHRLGIRKGIEYNKIIKAKNKKADYNFNIFIDDNPFMINDMKDHPNKLLLLYTTPVNKNYSCESRNVLRVFDWRDISNKIIKMNNLKYD